TDRLLNKVHCDEVDLAPWLGHVYVADTLDQAFAKIVHLSETESVVTREGIWMGRTWLAAGNDDSMRAGILERASEIDALQEGANAATARIGELQDKLTLAKRELQVADEKLAEQRRVFGELSAERTDLHNRLGALEARAEALNHQRGRGQEDLAELDRDAGALAQALQAAQTRLATAQDMSVGHQSRRTELSDRRDALRAALEDARRIADAARDAKHQAEFDRERLQTTINSTRQRIERLVQQTASMTTRQEELRALLATDDRPEAELTQELETLLKSRIAVESRLAEVRSKVAELDEALRNNEHARVAREQDAQDIRSRIGELQVGRQEIAVRRDTLYEQIQESGHRPQEVLAELPDDAGESQWTEQLESVMQRIERIGPVNLVAIEEYEEQSERKVYLDKQYEDLTEALGTLEGVIQKIDRETRSRFKQTFENLDARFQEFFPKLFGGGSAYLELTGTDLLDTGVGVMARPPGKRNSTIHLLSGGEKALTAVSLIFAFFDLNPAPFCMLDEVDAPLDDANVERYSSVLSTLAAKTQLIFITHNKITMEVANILIGVTMAEPGVSRLVAVDVDEAIEMAAS
ncbi:MAG: chromosome segregation protein SMC, partial [Gammaproteobacteria bacterium]|nr:chromosome segregation protein SMC [Gammaproteobacteria bacterium]